MGFEQATGSSSGVDVENATSPSYTDLYKLGDYPTSLLHSQSAYKWTEEQINVVSNYHLDNLDQTQAILYFIFTGKAL